MNQSRIFRFGVADDNIVIRNQERIGDFTLCGKGFTGTGSTQNQSVGVLELLSVHHDKVVRQSIQPVIERFSTILEQLLRGKGDEDRRGAGGQRPLDLDQVIRKRKAAHQALLLLEVQPSQVAVVLLGDGVGLEHIVLQFLLGAPGVQHQKCHHEHSLILALQFFQK